MQIKFHGDLTILDFTPKMGQKEPKNDQKFPPKNARKKCHQTFLYSTLNLVWGKPKKCPYILKMHGITLAPALITNFSVIFIPQIFQKVAVLGQFCEIGIKTKKLRKSAFFADRL